LLFDAILFLGILLGHLGEHLADLVTANAAGYAISALALCGAEHIDDQSAKQLVLQHAADHDGYASGYRGPLAGIARSATRT